MVQLTRELPSSPQKSSIPFEQDKKALYEAGSFMLGKYSSNNWNSSEDTGE